MTQVADSIRVFTISSTLETCALDDVCKGAEGVNESWKPVAIEPFGAVYECSDLGNVRRIGSSSPLKPGRQSRGYMSVVLYVPNAKPKQPKSVTVHRIVAATWLEGPAKPELNHKDGDKTNNAASNLEWVTHQENMRHSWANGLHKMGQRHYSKMSERDARAALRLSAAGVSDKTLGEVFGVTESCVRLLIAGKTWAALPRPEGARRRGAKTAADILRAKRALSRFVNARTPQYPRGGNERPLPSMSEARPESAA